MYVCVCAHVYVRARAHPCILAFILATVQRLVHGSHQFVVNALSYSHQETYVYTHIHICVCLRQSCCVALAGIELAAILLPPKCCNYWHGPP